MVAVIGEVEARRVLGSNHLVDGGLVRGRREQHPQAGVHRGNRPVVGAASEAVIDEVLDLLQGPIPLERRAGEVSISTRTLRRKRVSGSDGSDEGAGVPRHRSS